MTLFESMQAYNEAQEKLKHELLNEWAWLTASSVKKLKRIIYNNKMEIRKLEYGKWYSVDECLPEDFEELIALDNEHGSISHDVLVISKGHQDCYALVYRAKLDVGWAWSCFNKLNITHWLAIPKISCELKRRNDIQPIVVEE